MVLPFLIHLFVSPEINKSHSNASLDFSMHLPHTPWDLTEAYWYLSSRSGQLIFIFFFSQNIPKDSLSSCSAWPDRFLPRCCPHMSLFGLPCDESLISWIPHLPLSSFIPFCWRSFSKNDLRNDIGGRCESPCVWNYIYLDVWLVFRWAEYFRLKVIFP